MTTEKKLGIWMDHSSAHIMEFSQDPIVTISLVSEFTHDVKIDSLSKSERIMQNKEKGTVAEYYKQLGEIIEKYDRVLLFGPTDAKVELFNILKEDQHFKKIKIEIEQTDKMTEKQEHAFVKEYFSKT
jgi:hypothetical protein